MRGLNSYLVLDVQEAVAFAKALRSIQRPLEQAIERYVFQPLPGGVGASAPSPGVGATVGRGGVKAGAGRDGVA